MYSGKRIHLVRINMKVGPADFFFREFSESTGMPVAVKLESQKAEVENMTKCQF